ncbi:MAG: urease accessory protein UreE [Pseudomonadota bacterium]
MSLKRVVSISHDHATADDTITLPHEARHLRRKKLTTDTGTDIAFDLPNATHLHDGDTLALDDGTRVSVRAAVEPLMSVTAARTSHAELCWHIGNRHLPAQLDPDRILLQRDPIIRTMLEGLGAQVEDIDAPFQPLAGAYHSHSHAENHD